MKRLLSKSFIDDLICGSLKELLAYVKNDDTLDLEIRNKKINIYYRGGNALQVVENRIGCYVYSFDKKYLADSQFISYNQIQVLQSNSDWNKYFPLVKQAMDFYFTKHHKEEREYQQLVVRDNNNSSIANSTDYFIIDIEYDNHKNARFDIVAIEWPSDASKRQLKKGYTPKLVVIEMKYGDLALKGDAGIKKHIDDFMSFTSSSQEIGEFKSEMLGVFEQKRKLGLIECLSAEGNNNVISHFADNIEFFFLFANHDPAKSTLQTELSGLAHDNIKFFVSSFLGYGLFKDNVFDYATFFQRFQFQIYNAL